MIVKLDRITFHAELDARALGTLFAINDDLSGDAAMRLAAKKAHDIGSPECDDGGGAEVFVDTLQIAWNLKRTSGAMESTSEVIKSITNWPWIIDVLSKWK